MRAFSFTLTLICISCLSQTTNAQNNAGKFGLEISDAKLSLNGGPYRGRSASTNGFFNQGVAFMGQIYFPFQLTVDYRKNFSDSAKYINEYNNRIFLIRPSALLHYVDNGSYAFGLGCQFSWLISYGVYIEYQISGIYLEATKEGLPDLNSGFNLHHYVSISKSISKKISLAVGLIHFSDAHLTSGDGANQDVLSIGFTYSF